MAARVRDKLNYANVVSTLCLFLLLGGGAYAASRLPANSVGTKQLKNGAVTAAKIKAGTLQARDFGPGLLSAGEHGTGGSPGATGPAGPAGPPGEPGGTGAAGPGATAISAELGPTEQQLASVGGLTLSATCTPVSKPAKIEIKAAATVVGRFTITGVRREQSTVTPFTEDFVINSGKSLVYSFQYANTTNENATGTVTFTYTTGGGEAVTGVLGYYMQNGGGECIVGGSVVPAS